MPNIKNKRLKDFYKSRDTEEIRVRLSLPWARIWGDLSTKQQIRFLCTLSAGKTVLEIGTFRGVTTYNLSKYADKVVTLDIGDGGYDGTDYGDYILGKWFRDRNKGNIQQVICDTRTFDFSSLKTMFDVILVDGDHSVEGCINDFTKGLYEYYGYPSYPVFR